MKLKDYLFDYLSVLVGTLILTFLIYLLLYVFKTPTEAIIVVCGLIILSVITFLIYDYLRKKSFYDALLFQVENLDDAYLVLEMIKRPSFLEGELLYDALYEINKSMRESVKALENQNKNFKEYLELWIHEIKIPVSSLLLMFHNHKDQYDEKAKKQVAAINDYLEQILYYERSEISSNDYLIKEVQLKDIIHTVALKNMDVILEKNITLKVDCQNETVISDGKWLEFIVNQIVNNAIQYMDDKKEKVIHISTKKNEKHLQLLIEDNGIGISPNDLPKVFDKSFTGNNGRIRQRSTGMGLYICKSLCTKLGHHIYIHSTVSKGTAVTIDFYNHDYYDVTRS